MRSAYPWRQSSATTAVLSIVDKKRVKGLDWEEQNLDQVTSYLRTITGLNFYVSPKVRQEKFEDVVISTQLDDVSVRDILDTVVTDPYELRWEPLVDVDYRQTMVGQRFRYSRWDGTQKGFELDA